MMQRLLVIVMMASLAPALQAQHLTPEAERMTELMPVPSIYSNSVTKLATRGDSLWVGPLLDLTIDGGDTWRRASVDSLSDERNRVFSIDTHDDVVIVGLGYASEEAQGTVQAAGGFLVSTDGGNSFTYRFPQLDSRGDTTVTYGVSTLRALDVVVPQQSPPYMVDYDPTTGDIWVAGWASGIRRSVDLGRTWDRVVLPPDDLEEIHPDSTYDFYLAPQRGPTGHLNHMGFAVKVDSRGNVWAGTPVGINRKRAGEESWRRFSATGSPNSLTGSWVVDIEEQILDGESLLWLATWNAGEAGEAYRDGITMTRDFGETFEQMLIGETVYDFAFRGETIYAAAESGLFISDDVGQTWRSVIDFYDAAQPDRIIRPDVETYAVEVTSDALWVGTSDGLMKSTDGGQTWRIFRAEVPLHPNQPSERVPDVDTYAYPNPFSPATSRFVRIRFELDQSSASTIRIYDFEMQLVRSIEADVVDAGAREVVWDGTDDSGLRVANGPYIYVVDADGRRVDGKILVIE